VADIVEAGHPERELTEDQQRVTVSDEIQGVGYGTGSGGVLPPPRPEVNGWFGFRTHCASVADVVGLKTELSSRPAESPTDGVLSKGTIMSRVLITGSSQGIGRATAIELAARGHDVVATARRPQTLADLPAAQRLALDVTDDASVDAAITSAGEIDVLVSNAGATLRGTIEHTPLAEFERLYELNTIGALRVVKAVLPAMRRRGTGKIIFLSSILGRLAIPLIGAYAQSKWALEAIAETLALEVGPLGIEVSLLEPAMVSTDGPRSATNHKDDTAAYAALWERLGQMPADLAIRPEDVARAVADTVEGDHLPLRSPVGVAARQVLGVLGNAASDQAFDTIAALGGAVR
jgi:NAD(P)-dependent dehydrogenase (short-subunit alcohol dehydrogenase family)